MHKQHPNHKDKESNPPSAEAHSCFVCGWLWNAYTNARNKQLISRPLVRSIRRVWWLYALGIWKYKRRSEEGDGWEDLNLPSGKMMIGDAHADITAAPQIPLYKIEQVK